jgi:hypothetical protein
MVLSGMSKMWARSWVSEITQNDGCVSCEPRRGSPPYGCPPIALAEGLGIDHQCVDQGERRLFWDGVFAMGLDRFPVPGTDLLADVAAEDLIA